MEAIITQGLSKTYGEQPGIVNIDLSVATGELFGLIGPDGAGKTTLIRLLASLLLPDSGDAWLEGRHVVRDYRAVRRMVGYMPGRFSLYQDLTVAENLEFFATLFGTTVAEGYALVKDIYQQIEPFAKRRAGALSGGMKQKLALSCALIHRPSILLLDEPTTGVDAVSRREFWDMLTALREHGITVLVATPYMDEAARCDRIALMQGGRILAVDRPQTITDGFNKPLFAVRADRTYQLIQDLRRLPEAAMVYPFGEHVHLIARDRLDAATVEQYLQGLNYQRIEVRPVKPTIEDYFLDLLQAA